MINHKVLASVAILFGLYLIFFFFAGRKNNAEKNKEQLSYHLGCYSPDLFVKHSINMQSTLSKIKQSSEQLNYIGLINSIAFKPNFDSDMSQLAKSFESYLQESYKIINQNQGYSGYNRQLQHAKYQFKNCKNNIHFNEQVCLNSWENYEKSDKYFNDEKQKLKGKIQLKFVKQKEIKKLLLLEDEQIDQSVLLESYRVKIERNKEKMFKIDEEIILKRDQKLNLKEQLQQLQAEINQIQALKIECRQNKGLKFCKELSQSVKVIPVATHKTELEQKLKNKLKIIQLLKKKVGKAQLSNDITLIQQSKYQLNHHEEQYKILQAWIIQYDTFEIELCQKCSKIRLSEQQRKLIKFKSEILMIQEKQKQFEICITRIQKERNQLQIIIASIENQLQHQRNKSLCDQGQKCNQKQINQIKLLRSQLFILNNDIIDLKSKFLLKQQQNNANIRSLDKIVDQVHKIGQCIGKKNLYQQLISLMSRYRSPSSQINTLQSRSQRIIQQLDKF